MTPSFFSFLDDTFLLDGPPPDSGQYSMQMGQLLNIDVDKYLTDKARPVFALGGTYPASHRVKSHSHVRNQLLCPLSGIIMASTAQGAWTIPAGRGLWIPAGVRHELRMQGEVQMQSMYFDPTRLANVPDRCVVVAISPLMAGLMKEAVALPALYDVEGRSGALMRLIEFEVGLLGELPLSLSLPTDKALSRLCRKFLLRPKASANIDSWAAQLNLSRRTFTRFFRRQTGLSFVAWRQQACILAALPMLSSGASVTETAFQLGYQNPAAFTTLFKRVLGVSPTKYTRTATNA